MKAPAVVRENFGSVEAATARGNELRKHYELVDCWFDMNVVPEWGWTVTARVPRTHHTLQEQFERGYLDVPGMGRKTLKQLDDMSAEVRRIAADALRSAEGQRT